jgi:exoribonuclease R
VGGWTTRIRQRPPVENWNAEISLLTGTAAAALMLDAGVGVLLTLPAPEPSAVEQLKRTAGTLGITWPDGATAAQVLSGLPRDTGPALALRRAASALLRGAGYAAFDQATGTAPPEDPGHGGIGAPYAHVTAPLRRLVDRFGTEVCLAVAAGAALPDWLTAALPTLPSVMAESDAVAAKVERACVDRTEAALLASRVGAEFAAVVLRASGPENEPGEVFIAEPPVLAKGTGLPRAGEVVRVELVEADPTTGRITFRAE